MTYGAAKAAVNHLSKCVAMEPGEHNLRLNSVSPGAIATGILPKALGIDASKADALATQMQDVYAKAQPIPRSGVPDDIASACCGWPAIARALSTPPTSWSTVWPDRRRHV